MHLIWILWACGGAAERRAACEAARALEHTAWKTAELRAEEILAEAEAELAGHEADLLTAKRLAEAASFRYEEASQPIRKLESDLSRRCTGILGCYREAIGQAEALSRGERVDPHPRLEDLVERLARVRAETRTAEQARVEAGFTLGSVRELRDRAEGRKADLALWRWRLGELRTTAARGRAVSDEELVVVEALGTRVLGEIPASTALRAAAAATREACAEP